MRHHLRLPRFCAVTLLVIAAVFMQWAATGTRAAAAPTGVGVGITMTKTSVTFALKDGSAQVRAGELLVRDRAGADVGRVPLSYRMDDRQYPIEARVVGRTVTLTPVPVRDVARSTAVDPREVAMARTAAKKESDKDKPKTRQERDDQALARFNQQVQAGMSLSALIGMTIGAVVGGTIGCILGIAAAVIGCLVAVAPAAGVGAIAGTILGGGGSAIAAGVQYFRTITAPFP